MKLPTDAIRGGAAVVLFAATVVAAQDSVLSVDVGPGTKAEAILDLKVDDTDLADPPGYFLSERPVAQVVTRVTVENVGDTPIKSPVLRVDGKPFLTMNDPLEFLGLPKESLGAPALYNAWTARRVHGTTDLRGNRDAVEVLRSIGATFCGDDARALGRLVAPAGIEMRFARVSGHSAGEFKFADGWTLIDGDQNTFYLGLDNVTPVSEADILSDPFPVLRTKVYGRQATWSSDAAYLNTARFGFADLRDQKNFRVKGDPAPTEWTMLPTETLTFFPGREPEAVVAKTKGLAQDSTLIGATRVGEFAVDLAARRKSGTALRSPFPILSVQTAAGEVKIAEPGAEPILQIDLPDGDRATLICQAARGAIPGLRSGSNTLESQSELRVSFALNAEAGTLVEVEPATVVADAIFENHIPTFRISGPAEKVWWQVSDNLGFTVVPPNFDTVGKFEPVVRLSSRLDRTFLNPGKKYYFRARIRRDGVWGDWSEPVTFNVRKPTRPEITGVLLASGGVAEITFEKQDGSLLIYGSNRLDFLPQAYADREPVRIEDNRVVEDRPNKNLLNEVDGQRGFAIVPIRRFYRLIAKADQSLSVPSSLARLPPGDNLPTATALQNRHVKADGALTGRDVATEQPVSGW